MDLNSLFLHWLIAPWIIEEKYKQKINLILKKKKKSEFRYTDVLKIFLLN